MSRFPLGKMLSVVFLGFITYRIFLFGSAEFIYRISPEKISSTMLTTSSLYFRSDVYRALAEEALKQGKVQAAEYFTLTALKKNHTNGRAMVLAIDVYEELNDERKQSQAVYLTSKLWKSHLFARSKLAQYWSKKDDKESLLAEWNILLLQDKNLEKSLFPVMLSFLEQASTKSLLQPYLSKPPTWWGRFFSFVSKKATHQDSVKWLYEARKESPEPLSQVEYRSYIKRLVANNQWQSAFSVWNDQIKADDKSYESYVYDGGFEAVDVKSKRNSVFDWRVFQRKGVKFDSRLAFGANKKALRLEFIGRKEKIKFKHLSQILMLEQNKPYKASFRVRTGGVKGKSNLLWRLYCLGSEMSVIGESPVITSSPKWKKISLSFKTPATNCSRQLLRLESKSTEKTYFNGRFWFDDILVSKD